MRMPHQSSAAAFSDSADAYQQTMAIALAPVAVEVLRRAALQPGETVIDVGCGTGNATALAVGEGRRVTGLDAAPGMLAIARGRVPDATFVEADFTALPLDDGHADVTLAVHALLFAEDRIAALREWHRVTRSGGRLALSVPGPEAVVPSVVFGTIYDAYDIPWGMDYPTPEEVGAWATDAGWSDVALATDPTMGIPLPDEAAFRTWLGVGARGRLTAGWDADRREAFTQDLIAAAPRDENGGYRLPFGAIYLTATRD